MSRTFSQQAANSLAGMECQCAQFLPRCQHLLVHLPSTHPPSANATEPLQRGKRGCCNGQALVALCEAWTGKFTALLTNIAVRELAELQETVRTASAELTQLAGLDESQVTAVHATRMLVQALVTYCICTFCTLQAAHKPVLNKNYPSILQSSPMSSTLRTTHVPLTMVPP